MQHALIEIVACLVEQPVAQATRTMLGAPADVQLRQSDLGRLSLHHAPRLALTGKHDAVEFTAQRQQRTVAERHRSRQTIEPLAHPLDVAAHEGAGLADIALDGKRHDDGAARAAHPQCQTSRAWMAADLDRTIELLDVGTFRR